MIGRLQGRLILKRAPHLLIDVNGVGYEVDAPMSSFYALPELGEEVTLLTHMVVREDAQLLFGFVSESERSFFRKLIKINGVGAKMALVILSGMSVDSFARCIQEGDVAGLVRLPGVGKKTAERLIVEMKDKLQAEIESSLPSGAVLEVAARKDDPLDDALSALVALGYKPAEAARMVKRIACDGLSSEEIIRQALKGAAS